MLENDQPLKGEIFVSTDVETTGPIPGTYSMIQIGSAAFAADGSLVSQFSANIKELPEAKEHPDTMKFWSKFPAVWNEIHIGMEDAAVVMARYVTWLDSLYHYPVFVAWPAGFDFTFVYWYLMHFCDRSPFFHRALDMKSFAMGMLGWDWNETQKYRLKKDFKTSKKHTHRAIDDAVEQGEIFMKLYAQYRKNRPIHQ